MAVADLTGDGEPDIVTTNYGGNSVSVLLNNGDGTFGTQQTFATDLSPVQTIVADVNGDGRPDLVTVSNHDSAIGVLLGKGNGTFEPVAAGGVGLTDTPLLADFNGDGIPDTVVLDRSGNILYRAGTPRRRRHLRAPGDPQPRAAGARHHDLADRVSVRHRGRRRSLRPHALDRSICLHRLDLHDQRRRRRLAHHRVLDHRAAHEPHRRRLDRQRA